ncbi:MAG: peptidase M61 [Alphaproteobacteria bacterium]|nr:peptidase M61 [Alphaproteobacteria bacterium]
MSGAAFAQTPVPTPPGPPAPKDEPYPGVLTLEVDASDIVRGVFSVRETIPVAASGPMTILYPAWIPGHHSPSADMAKVGGITIRAGRKQLEWRRDAIDMYALHVNAPEGAQSITVEFQYLSARGKGEGRVVATPAMLNLQWNSVSFYPAGFYVSRIPVSASLTLPHGWRYGTALRAASKKGDRTTFKQVSYETLVDSPVFAGAYFKQFVLDDNPASPIVLDAVADEPQELDAPEQALEAHKKLVEQADKLYGSRHFDHYDFLAAVTSELGGIGLEHHRSSENSVRPDYFTGWASGGPGRDLLAHEYTHSWNGKFRRPADLWTPNYDVPMRDSLLWVYEGQTQYWGYVLSARSGLLSKQQTLDAIALTAATYDMNRPGRRWRALQDTTNDPIIARREPLSWRSWQRSEDYYSEGELIWLDADTLIREKTGGQKSLDDFAKAFFGVRNGDWTVDTYDFKDVVDALNSVYPYDWAEFLRARLDGHGPGAPLDGIARGGYRLVYDATPSDYYAANDKRRKQADFTFSIGLILDEEGGVKDVRWDGPAFRAGLTTAGKIVSVDGFAYNETRLKNAITQAARKGAGPIRLIVKIGERYENISVDYHGGLRYPHLVRIEGKPALLDDILAAK